MAEERKFDPKNHVVIASWPEARRAVVMLLDAELYPFVSTYGYNPETRDWNQGSYYRTVWPALVEADPDIIEHLSQPTRVRDLLQFMQDNGCEGASEEDALEYADNCSKYVLLTDSADARCVESEDVAEWWEKTHGKDGE